MPSTETQLVTLESCLPDEETPNTLDLQYDGDVSDDSDDDFHTADEIPQCKPCKRPRYGRGHLTVGITPRRPQFGGDNLSPHLQAALQDLQRNQLLKLLDHVLDCKAGHPPLSDVSNDFAIKRKVSRAHRGQLIDMIGDTYAGLMDLFGVRVGPV